MKILLITDIHYGEDVNYSKHGVEGYINSFGSKFEEYVPKVQDLISKHDLTINLGDLIKEKYTNEDLSHYKNALSLLGKNGIIKHVAGNHDVNNLTREQLVSVWGESKTYYSFDLFGYHHIVLDGIRDSKEEPHRIDTDQIEWLKNNLANTNLKTLIYCHYPLDDQSLDSNYYFSKTPEKGFISNKKEIRNILEDSLKVMAVFNGHLHFYNRPLAHLLISL